VAARAAAVEECQSNLEQLQTAEAQQCAISEDCLCDEARVRTQDQVALCASVTETYEAAFCESHTMCNMFHECHIAETEVYNSLRSDVEVEMATIVQEYIAVEQAQCLTGLIMGSLASGNPILHADLIACSNVDVSALDLVFPNLPEEPAACPAPVHGSPFCVAPTTPEEDIQSEHYCESCRQMALDLGLELGGAGYSFMGNYGTSGCYTYTSGTYRCHAYCGTRTAAAANAPVALPKIRLEGFEVPEECTPAPQSEHYCESCRQMALDLGLELGGAGYSFMGNYGTSGCYTYTSGTYQCHAYCGTRSAAAANAPVALPQIRLEGFEVPEVCAR
jgi:hypothetical protein